MVSVTTRHGDMSSSGGGGGGDVNIVVLALASGALAGAKIQDIVKALLADRRRNSRRGGAVQDCENDNDFQGEGRNALTVKGRGRASMCRHMTTLLLEYQARYSRPNILDPSHSSHRNPISK
jgi:hypothetical protein